MRRFTLLLSIATVGLLFSLGPVAHAQTVTTLPGIPAGQGGPDNGVNASEGGDASGGGVNPTANAGPATSDEGSSLAPWLVGAALLVVLGAGGALIMAKAAGASRSGDARRGTTIA